MAKSRANVLFPLTARTATANSAVVPTAIGGSKPITTANDSLCGSAIMAVSVSAVTSATLALSLNGSFDGSNFFTLTPSSAWGNITTAVADSRIYAGPLPPYLRATGTLTGTSMTYEVDIQLTDVM